MSPDWKLPDEWRAWARKHFPKIDVGVEAPKFKDHWLQKPGKAGVKLEWSATWRNWIRRADEWRRERAGPERKGSGPI